MTAHPIKFHMSLLISKFYAGKKEYFNHNIILIYLKSKYIIMVMEYIVFKYSI